MRGLRKIRMNLYRRTRREQTREGNAENRSRLSKYKAHGRRGGGGGGEKPATMTSGLSYGCSRREQEDEGQMTKMGLGEKKTQSTPE